MIAAFMSRHFGFCLSVELELSGFEFKSSLNLEQVCKNQKMKKVSIFFSLPAPYSGLGPLAAQPCAFPCPSRARVQPSSAARSAAHPHALPFLRAREHGSRASQS